MRMRMRMLPARLAAPPLVDVGPLVLQEVAEEALRTHAHRSFACTAARAPQSALAADCAARAVRACVALRRAAAAVARLWFLSVS
jgi:hypothetical protein